VDWGDGVIENYSANVVAQHEYNYSTYDTAGATLCSRGYKQAIITVTPQSGRQFTLININKRHSTLTSTSVSSGFLEVSIAGSGVTGVCIGNWSVGSTGFNIVHALLESASVICPSLANCTGIFNKCYSLRHIPQLVTTAVTNMSYMFQNCYSLQTIPQLVTSAVTNMSNMFQNCYSLQTIPQLDTSAVTNMSYMFQNCYSLQTIPQLVTSAVTNMSNMFQNCYSLQTIPQLDTSAVTNMSYMFQNCYSLSSMKATGIAQSISVASCKLSATKLNEIYSNLKTVTGKTITVTGNYGTASDDPSIAITKGWTVTG
jgi:surface protein